MSELGQWKILWHNKRLPLMVFFLCPKLKGGTYVPTFNNQELANKPVVNVSVQKDNESIRVLQEQLAHMKEQTSLLLNHLGNSGNTTVIATQVSSDQVLQILQQNPAALQNILGRNKSNGWR